MKKVIKRAAQRYFRNNLHFEFFTGIVALLTVLGASITHIAELIKQLVSLLAQEDEALDQLRRYEHTSEIHTADKVRDNLFYGLRDAIRRSCKHPNTAVAAAALRLHMLFEQFKTVPKMALPEETGAMHQLLQHLDKQTADTKLLGLTEVIDQMRSANSEVRQLTKERDSEASLRVHAQVKTVRSEVDSVYSNILSHIEAAVVLEGAEKYTALINEINTRVDNYKAIYAREKGNDEK